MSVGLLVITHERLATVFVDIAINMLGGSPLAMEVLPVPGDCDPEKVRSTACEKISMLDEGDGVLVLTDIYGSTPSNIVNPLIDEDRIQVVAGVNLPMLIRVLNYPELGLAELTQKAVSGGREGVLVCPAAKGA
jgi:mannose PTS system EIIA component